MSRVREMNCMGCGTLFTTSQPARKYCGKTCSRKSSNEKQHRRFGRLSQEQKVAVLKSDELILLQRLIDMGFSDKTIGEFGFEKKVN